MSGIEIAGLVIGCIPLLVAALEHYEDIIGPTLSMFKYRGELERATRELRNQRSMFQQSIMVLLKPITRAHELSEMMDNSGSPLWKEKSIELALEEHLDIAYLTYLDVVHDIENIIIQIATKLEELKGLEGLKVYGLQAIVAQHAPARKNGKAGTFEFSKAIKFTMSRQKIRSSLKELSRLIDMLDKIQTKADKMKDGDEVISAHSRSKFAIPLHIIRKNAAKLYQVLFKTWCSRHNAHLAGLLLEQRLVRKSKRGMPGWQKHGAIGTTTMQCADASRFGVSILRSCSSDKWLDLEIKPVDPDHHHSKTPTAVKVRILAPDSATTTHIDASNLPFGDPSKLQIVTDICATLQPCLRCIGLYLDHQGQLRGTVDTARSIDYVDNGLTLKELISQQLGQISLRERYSLSITLTSSLLQLAQTPWLKDSWSEADIMFLRARTTQSGSGITVDVERPYLTRKQNAMSMVTRTAAPDTDSSKLLQLAVMLLEIYYGRSIEELYKMNPGTNNSPMTEIANFQAVRQLLTDKKNSGEISHGFLTAISFCHQCFADGSASLSNEDLSKAIEAKVLIPLEDEMHMVLFGPEAR